MDIQLPTAIVTGASSGYGVGIAKVLIQRGHNVFITARNAEKLEAVASQIGATAIVADATSGSDWDRVIETVMKATGHIDVLINNAGAGGKIAPIEEQTDEEITQTLMLNLNSVFFGCRRVAPIMRQSKRGTIINISSICAKYSWPGWSVYSAAKAGIERLSKGLYLELREAGVRVTCLTPSWGDTEFSQNSNIAGHPSLSPEIRAACTKPEELGEIVANIVTTPPNLEIIEMTVVPNVQEISPL
ncbi:SDR family oxidoreductase [Coraliomargarita algicola]|uniref:SDR family oxidoreductase n=1 Tax=Coraliomargarita algicola TaxID=3092156 RepID=A0ABZ0RQA7_9BACT|nr:SDR family oxidoreductase [Coraliomargarita sp. J2-16]WPJ96950.1 SDR family oxidoreductase [Coraliomargarita sp. J2-16]